ncbi:Asp-tRNAAsn/Glu-tRNAGln amidotransferase A subunit [Halorubrum aquaticum]|uniref:Asp-tRNAAsn/Glu-tRNAGln amidotransferase A subunit n=1 Tax=Halorubrum aquaticum TaxID=387340 RepID=A0A1I3AAQ2_9EURY|nr:amidase family protein [Halorubrum aquaticum]SFH47193.1 Asp-tRNAAsn/Glu-tRNAGln amidotransferase A subunit [Halorubrum aquaticum]
MDDPTTDDDFDFLEATVGEIHAAFEAETLTAEGLTEAYLDRIAEHADDLNAVLTVNEDALSRARELDDRFEADGPVGPLHGIPTAIKDNHDTADMPTTAGSKLFAEFVPDEDAFVVERLREAGAVILAKTNLQELSFGVDSVSSLGGETRNPYALDRRPSGSSGGTAAAIASNLAAVGTGTDTCSSVRSPPAFTNLVGLRPTRGLVSRTGIVPLSATQDTAGPITRTVADAARTLEAMVGYDPADPVTALGVGEVPEEGYAAHLDPEGLEGARIGVVRDLFEVTDPENPAADTAGAVESAIESAMDELAAAGATLVDPVEVVDGEFLDSARVVGAEFERDFDAYLAAREGTPVDSLRELAESGTMAPSVEERVLDGGILGVAEGVEDDPEYLRALARRETIRTETVDRLVAEDLDALLYPPSMALPVEMPEHQPFSEMRCELSAHTGLPSIVLPAGFAAGENDEELPVGFELLGRPFDEPRLLELGYAYERAVEPRSPPERFA